MNVVHLSPATPTEDLRALEEVDEFASTDMGWGGSDRWTYRVLAPEEVTPELLRQSQHAIYRHSQSRIDSVTFQPCQSYESRSQDRHTVQSWDMPGGSWTFSAVLDGHGSHSTVDFILEHLPSEVKSSLHSVLSSSPAYSPSTISNVLSDAIATIDDTITNNFLRLFPVDKDEFSRLSNADIAKIITKSHSGSGTPTVDEDVLRCMQGATVLLTLTAPNGRDLWIANLGDSRAILVSRLPNGVFSGRRMCEIHNGGNRRELRRIEDEHPGERECVMDDRVLGFLAPTRAVGDTWMKVPAVYSRRVLMRTREFWAAGLGEEYIDRVLSPPYVCNTAQVYHHVLRRPKRGRTSGSRARTGNILGLHTEGESEEEDIALILCSDGLVDLYEEQDFEEAYALHRWANVVGETMSHSRGHEYLTAHVPHPHPHLHPHPHAHRFVHGQRTREGAIPPDGIERTVHRDENVAVRLLRDAIGADDIRRASANLTVEMEERWIDDTTIVVHRFS